MATIKDINPFNPEGAAQGLRSAMKGIGTDEDAIIKIVASHSNKQRQEIKRTYKTLFGRDFDEDLRSEIGGHFLQAVEGAFALPAVYDARELHTAMKGAGTKESVVVEILASRSNAQLEAIKKAYKEEFGATLEDDLKGDLGGDLFHLAVSLVNAHRDESTGVDESKAREDAARLYEAGENRFGTDESVFNQILALRSIPQLQATFRAYVGVAGHDIEEAINSETSGDIQAGFLAVAKYAKNPSEYFAERLYTAMKGAGTNDDQMIRVIITRSEIDLAVIEKVFHQKYESDLRTFVEGECSGDYKNFLLAVLH